MANWCQREIPSKDFKRPSRLVPFAWYFMPVAYTGSRQVRPGCSFWENKVYEIRVRDDRINAYRVIRGENRYDVEAKAAAVRATWDDRWRRQQAAEAARKAREQREILSLDGRHHAQQLTVELESAAEALDSILVAGCDEPIPTWDDLNDHSVFAASKPAKPKVATLPKMPKADDYTPVLTLGDKLIPGKKSKRLEEARERYDKAFQEWQAEVETIKAASDAEEVRYRVASEEWYSRKRAHLAFIATLQESYKAGERTALEYLVSEALTRSAYPENFPVGFDLSFDPEAKTMVLDYELPNQEALPKYKEVKFIARRAEIQHVPVTETWRKATYDKLLYQMALRTIHRVFAVDKNALVYNVVFNGWVRSIDPATGSEAHGCILSVQAGRDEFMCLDLRRVDPKACFKSLKGVASSKLTDLTPVRPILKLNKDDARFVEAYAVAETVDERTNLAAMDWQDFENLIREIFERSLAAMEER
jgi:restriction system protein